MKTDFKFSNLLGTVYSRGNLLFNPEGTCLLSPVGNRVTVFDLVHNTSYTLPAAHRRNISRIALSPRGNLLLTVDQDGHAILTHFPRRIVLHHLTFSAPVSALAFSPSGRHFAIGVGRIVEVWHTPSTPDNSDSGELEFAPFVRHHRHAGHHDTVTNITWSSDSRFFITSSKDLTSRVWSLNPEDGFRPTTLAGHRQEVRGAWFSDDQETIYTVSKDGALFDWKYMGRSDAIMENGEEAQAIPTDERWRISKRHYFLQNNAHLTCAAFHTKSNLLVAGFSNGLFGLYELPDFNQIHTLSISQNDIDFVDINASGEWLAFGASKLGQLLVWEWQSESYILKQQGHFDSMNSIVYSPDGQKIITTADDGKIKVWDVNSGFCIVTFTEHTSGVTACEFAKRGNVLFTASLDGSIRAWDLIRYRNFRTFTAPTRQSFQCLAVDPSGEVVCAGSLQSFDIHVWSVQTGALLDQLAGHEGPISALAFSPNGQTIASGSWDHTVRLWSIFSRTQTSEPITLQADVQALAIRPDSQQLSVATLDGQLTFWSIANTTQTNGLDGRADVSGGRKATDRRTAANAAGTKSFSTLSYSADGACVLAAGNSKYICLYDVASGVLLKKFTVSINLDVQGTQEYLNSKQLTEAGPVSLIDTSGDAEDLQDRLAADRALPGAKRGGADAGVRTTAPDVQVKSIAFSPTNRSFCAASTEGLLIYSLDTTVAFDPFDLDVTVTPATISAAVASKSFLRALVMAFRLNERGWLRYVYERIPVAEIDLVLRGLPEVYVERLLGFVAREAEETPHVEVHLRWIEGCLSRFGRWIKEGGKAGGGMQGGGGNLQAELRAVEKSIKRVGREIGKVAEDNGFVLDYLLEGGGMAKKRGVKKKAISGVDGEDEDGEVTVEMLMDRMGDDEVEAEVADGQDNGDEDEDEDDDEDRDGKWEGVED